MAVPIQLLLQLLLSQKDILQNPYMLPQQLFLLDSFPTRHLSLAQVSEQDIGKVSNKLIFLLLFTIIMLSFDGVKMTVMQLLHSR